MALDLRRDRFNSATICNVVFLVLLASILNYPYRYVPTATQITQEVFSFSNLYDGHEVSYFEVVQAGFPFVWAASPEGLADGPLRYAWSGLVLNGMFWAVIACLTWFLTTRIKRNHTTLGTRRSVMRFLRSFEGVIIVGAIALLLIYGVGTGLAVMQNHRLKHELKRHGMVVTYALVPRPVARVAPSEVTVWFSKVREVVLWKPSPAAFEKAIQADDLITLVLVESTLPAESYHQLATLPHLTNLSFRYQNFTPADLTALAQLSRLEALDIRSCRGLQDWDCQLPLHNLKHLRVSHSDLRLSHVQLNGYKSTLQSLHLSRPRAGAEHFSLKGLPELKWLNLSRVGSTTNPSPLQLDLRELPELSALSLDVGQVTDLTIHNAPRLTTISYADDRADFGARGGEPNATNPLFRFVDIDNAPLLRELEIDGIHLEHISLKEVPSMSRLSIGRDGYRLNREMRPHPGAMSTRLANIIQEVGNLDGPPTVDFQYMPLGGLDLRPLKNNSRLRRLAMIRCGVDDTQADQLAEIRDLTSIDLRGCPISDQKVNHLLQCEAGLESLLVSAVNFESIQVIDQGKLKDFISTEAPNAVNVCIRNAPNLSTELLFGDKLQSLCIENARSLSGLSVDGPLPPNCELQGLRSLRFFAVGGPQASDALCQGLWQCADLDHLTIAYGALSKRSLQRVGNLSKLTVLSLPGSDVDDNLLMGHWRDLQFLSHVNLSDTRISGVSVQWLCGQKNLQQLAINHCPVDRRALASLADVQQLIELEVAGIGLDVELLNQCLSRSLIDRLNLSDFTLTTEHVELLASNAARNIRFLAIANCNLNDEQVRKIVDSHPLLAVDIEGNSLSKELLDSLQMSGRLVSRFDRREFIQFLMLERNQTDLDLIDSYDAIRGRINDYQFASTAQRVD